MFTRIRTFLANRIVMTCDEDQQQILDCLRYANAKQPMMQLHLDRMQTVLDQQAVAIAPAHFS